MHFIKARGRCRGLSLFLQSLSCVLDYDPRRGQKLCQSNSIFDTTLLFPVPMVERGWAAGSQMQKSRRKQRGTLHTVGFFGDQSCVGDVLWLPWNLACNRNFSRVKNARIGEFQNAALGKIKHFELGIKILCRPLASTSTVGTSKTLYGCRDLLRNLKDDKGSRRTAMVA